MNNVRVAIDQEVHPLRPSNRGRQQPAEREGLQEIVGSRISLAIDDDARMILDGREEIEWAQRIKTAISSSPELDSVSDLACVQLALKDGTHIEDAIDRATHMQTFRQEYQILDTYEDGCRCLEKLVQALPCAYLSFAFHAREGNYVLIYDVGKMDLQRLKNHPRHVDDILRGGYYLFHALCPDIESMKLGAGVILECEGFDWRKNINLSLMKRFWLELLAVYPLTYQALKYFHTGVLFNTFNALERAFLPRSIADKMETGCKFDLRLSEVYLSPNPEKATQRILLRMKQALLKRYNNEKDFILPPVTEPS